MLCCSRTGGASYAEKKAKGTLDNITTQFALERQDRKDARAERVHSNNENRRKNEL